MLIFQKQTQLYKEGNIKRGKNMEFILEEEIKSSQNLKSSISTPNSMYTSSIFRKELEIEPTMLPDSISSSAIFKMWNKQHPLIHTWLLLSSVSIFFLSALFFIVK